MQPLRFSYKIILEREGDNDGMVSLSSAKWGEFKGVVNVLLFNISVIIGNWSLLFYRDLLYLIATMSLIASIFIYLW